MAAVARGQPALGERPGGWGGAAPEQLDPRLFFACRCVNTCWKELEGSLGAGSLLVRRQWWLWAFWSVPRSLGVG